ncbi:hypothetical protein HHK36_014194 [Tetracentron sinense]|uniref:Uncharacterized protein n=1 Tax=Tetracentron sinense TaxID=13715 RepID=A0A835DF72_TETSI|nr:hypothetical protein HHK36_014194 [Tetracentron sinense]
MMFYQSSGQNQRPKGFKVKHAFQFALLLAVCIWFLYQIKHSYDKRKDYGGSVRNKLSEEHGTLVLGRKGNVGSSNGGEVDSVDRDPIGQGGRKEDGGAGDDELDRNSEEKAGEEFLLKGHEDSQGNDSNHEEKEEEKEPETQHKESKGEEENNTDIQVRKGDESVGLYKDMSKEDLSGKGRGDSQERLQDSDEDNINTQVREGDESMGSDKNKDKDKNSKHSEEEIAFDPSETENATVSGQNEIGNGVHGFHDENGVPDDGHDLAGSMLDETSDNQEKFMQQSISNNQSGLTENTISVAEANGQNDTETPVSNMIVKREEITYQVGSNTVNVKSENKIILEGSKIDTSADAKIKSKSGDSFEF